LAAINSLLLVVCVMQCGDCSCSCQCQTPECNEINCCCCQITSATPNMQTQPPPHPTADFYHGGARSSSLYPGPGTGEYGGGGTGSYPVYRDATMNPRYPLTTGYDTRPLYQPRPATGTTGIGTGTGGGTGTWMTGASAVPAAHQPRPATIASSSNMPSTLHATSQP